MELSQVQKDAINFYEGCCNVLASAGSGKTSVLVNRIVALIEKHDVAPWNILAITFSKKAKENMINRLKKLIPEQVDDVNIETFHSLGYRIIRKYSPVQYEILDQDWKKVKIIEEILQNDFREKEPDGREIADVLKYISTQKNQMKPPAGKERQDRIYRLYERYKSTNKMLDFDDMLSKFYEILTTNEKVLNFCQERYRFILADEMQDTNVIQFEILRLIGAKYHNVFFVGDPLQCWDGDNDVILKDGTQKKVKDLRVGDQVETALEKRSDFAAVTNITSSFRNDMVEVMTESGKRITTTRNHKFFAGNPFFSDEIWYLYLMYRKDKGFRIGVTNGGKTKHIRARVASEHPERLWILRQYNNQNMAICDEENISLQYQIPTIPYFNIGRQLRLSQDGLDKIFAIYGQNGKLLLDDFGMDFNFPSYVTQDFTDKNNRFATVKLTSNVVKNKNSVTYEENVIKEDGFRIRKVFSDFKQAYIYAHELKEMLNVDMVVERMSADERRMFNAVCASNLMPMMEILVSEHGKIITERIRSIKFLNQKRQVYDVEVAHTGNMIANGIVSHNCIYQWRGSDNQHMLDFDKEWSNATIIHLNKNYRSSFDIVNTANHFARCIPEASHEHYVESIADKGAFEAPYYKRYQDDLMESDDIATIISHYVQAGYKYSDMAILSRTNAQLQNFEAALYRNEIPYETSDGKSFVDRREIKIVLCYLRLANDINDDEAFEYIYNRPNRYLGKAFLQEVKKYARKMNMSLYCAMFKVSMANWRYKNAAREIGAIIGQLQDGVFKNVGNTIQYIRERLNLDSYVSKDLSDDDDSKVENLDALQRMASRYSDIKKFITFVSKINTEKKKDSDAVNLMTIHKSKGLEFPIVFVVGVNQGLLPHEKNQNINEEKRLMYVAMTRAEKILYITSTAQYNGKESKESEFISLIFK